MYSPGKNSFSEIEKGKKLTLCTAKIRTVKSIQFVNKYILKYTAYIICKKIGKKIISKYKEMKVITGNFTLK